MFEAPKKGRINIAIPMIARLLFRIIKFFFVEQTDGLIQLGDTKNGLTYIFF